MKDELKCRVCGATEPKSDPGNPRMFPDWEIALPDNLEGAVLLDNEQVWCSQECRDRDPRYRSFVDGADMFEAYNAFGEAHGLDLVGAFAKSRGVSGSEALKQLQDGFDKGLTQLRKLGRQ